MLSSAKFAVSKSAFQIKELLVSIFKSSGPKIRPWRTPKIIFSKVLWEELTFTQAFTQFTGSLSKLYALNSLLDYNFYDQKPWKGHCMTI